MNKNMCVFSRKISTVYSNCLIPDVNFILATLSLSESDSVSQMLIALTFFACHSITTLRALLHSTACPPGARRQPTVN